MCSCFGLPFLLTRPFGATFGDLLTKSKEKGGLDLGTLQASMVIFALFVVSFAFEMYYLRKEKKAKDLKDTTTIEDPVNETKEIDKDSAGVSDEKPTKKAKEEDTEGLYYKQRRSD